MVCQAVRVCVFCHALCTLADRCFYVVFSVDRPYFNPHMVIPDVRDAKLKEGCVHTPRFFMPHVRAHTSVLLFLQCLGPTEATRRFSYQSGFV